ncbi:MAG: O-methyltransferase [Prevotellaceae bacterium]|jgi:predicted O-methyltransferase YrrM|nr:O-methyltransferase [Prevotellaceae bacterium]
MQRSLDDYILQHSQPEPDYLKRIARETYVKMMNPRMISGYTQGCLLKMFCRMIRPKQVVEIGTFTGYGTLWLAAGMSDDARLHTIEINDELEDTIRSNLKTSPHEKRIILHIGDAIQIIPTLEGTFDMAFIDGNKRYYREYYEALMPKISAGGFILADNTLWGEKVVENLTHGDRQTRAVLNFNAIVAQDSRVEALIIPLRDGLSIIRKK